MPSVSVARMTRRPAALLLGARRAVSRMPCRLRARSGAACASPRGAPSHLVCCRRADAALRRGRPAAACPAHSSHAPLPPPAPAKRTISAPLRSACLSCILPRHVLAARLASPSLFSTLSLLSAVPSSARPLRRARIQHLRPPAHHGAAYRSASAPASAASRRRVASSHRLVALSAHLAPSASAPACVSLGPSRLRSVSLSLACSGYPRSLRHARCPRPSARAVCVLRAVRRRLAALILRDAVPRGAPRRALIDGGPSLRCTSCTLARH
jgi:hypothetical protein